MIQKQQNKQFLFIDPFGRLIKNNNAGIPFLRGFLQDKGYNTELINLHKMINGMSPLKKNEIIEPLDLYIKKLLKKEKVSTENIEEAYFYGLFLHNFYNKFWQATDRFGKKIEKIFSKNLNKFEKADYVGISIASVYELIFSLKLAKYIKNNCKNPPKIILGGYLITQNYSGLLNLLEKVPVIDCLVIGDGEFPLYYLAMEKEKSKIPGLIYLEHKRYKFSKNLIHSEDINKLSSPLFEKKDKLKFLQATKKCYWGKCAFCSYDTNKLRPKANIRDPKKVVDDIRKNIDTQNKENNYFMFSDNALPISFAKKFSEELIKNKDIKIRLASYLRFEKNIDYDFLVKAKKAGFELFLFGLETSSQRLLKLIEKGIEVNTALRIIDACSKLGIKMLITFIAGLPTQTKEELTEDLTFIKKIAQKYTNVLLLISVFFLDPSSKIFLFPQKYGLINDRNLRNPNYNFEQIDKEGLSKKETISIVKDFLKNEIGEEQTKGRIYFFYDAKLLSGQHKNIFRPISRFVY